jgi:hypothetical protein
MTKPFPCPVCGETLLLNGGVWTCGEPGCDVVLRTTDLLLLTWAKAMREMRESSTARPDLRVIMGGGEKNG